LIWPDIQQIDDGIEIRNRLFKADKNPNEFKILVIVSQHIVSHCNNNNNNENQRRDKYVAHSHFSGTIEILSEICKY
jgi:hypothetical protein